MTDTDLVLFVATYDTLNAAKLDLGAIKGLQYDHKITKVTAAIVSKNEHGRIHVHETTHAGKVAGASGLVAGAIIGAVFPPAGLAVAGAVAGAGAVGVVAGTMGHFIGGLSRKDLKEIGALLDEGHAAILAVAVDKVAPKVDEVLTRAVIKAHRHLHKEDVQAALLDIEKGVAEAQASQAEDAVVPSDSASASSD